MNPSYSTARSDLAGEVYAALKAEPATWLRLVKIGRAVAPRLSELPAAPISLPPDHRRTIAGLLPANSAASPAEQRTARALRRVMILLVELCAYGPAEALALCVDEAAELPDARNVLVTLARFLDDAKIDRALSDVDLASIEARRLRPPLRRPDVLTAAFNLLGLSAGSTPDDRRNVFQNVVVPRMRAAAALDDASALLAIEAAAYSDYIKAVETPEHHTAAFAAIEDAYAALPKRPVDPPRSRGSTPPLVVFAIPNGHLLAHSEVLLAFLGGLKALPEQPIEPFVLIYLSGVGGDLGERLDRLGVRWAAAKLTAVFDYEEHFESLKRQIAALEADSVVFVSLPQFLAYFMRRPLAPIQIWWSMKFALPNFATLQGRVFYRSLFEREIEIAGRIWRGGPLAFTPPAPPDARAVEAIRARYPGKAILGTIAREEKIANKAYLDAVVEILLRHPNTVFLWTGRTQPRQIIEAFQNAGVDDRCHFIGWVDPVPYIVAFDLFLETYPLTGLMSGWAMSLGKPIISVGSLGFLGTYLEPVLNGAIAAAANDLARLEAIFQPVRDVLPGIWASHPRDMPAFADELLADPTLRARLGDVQRRYVEAFMIDETASAAIQAKHFAAIIDEARTP